MRSNYISKNVAAEFVYRSFILFYYIVNMLGKVMNLEYLFRSFTSKVNNCVVQLL